MGRYVSDNIILGYGYLNELHFNMSRCFSGNKLIGVQILQEFLGAMPGETLHVGDQVSAGFNYSYRYANAYLIPHFLFLVFIYWKRFRYKTPMLYIMDC